MPTPPDQRRPGEADRAAAEPAVTTIAAYRKRTRQLAQRYLRTKTDDAETRASPGPYGADPMSLITWLASRKPELARSTWTQYRAALLYCLRTDGHETAAARLERISPDGTKKKAAQTSARKRRSLPTEKRMRLEGWLRAVGSATGHATAAWLEAGVLTGLRVTEWATATEIASDAAPALIVQNAKTSASRGNGRTRTLPLDHLTPGQLIVVRAHLARCGQMNAVGRYGDFYRACSELLLDANRALWPRHKLHYTLSSARHQFAANAKRQGNTKAGVASLMGHRSDATAGHHYGRAVSGERGGRGRVPRVIAAQAATVQVTAKTRRPAPAPMRQDATTKPHPRRGG